MAKDNYSNIYFDVENIMKFVFNLENNEGKNESVITEMYGINDATHTLELLNKQINENKSSINDSNTTMRYDFIKMMITMVLGMDEPELVTIGQRITLNTLFKEKFIKRFEKEK